MGRRLGWIEAPEFVVEAIESIQNSTILCPDMMHQMAMTRYIDTAIKNNTLLPYIMNVNKQYQIAAGETVASINKNLGFLY